MEPASTDVVLELIPGAHAAAVARRFVADHSPTLLAELADDAAVLVSELVTNAVLHGRPNITLRLSHEPPLIGVSVDDEGDLLPSTTLAAASPAATHGRGLMIVDSLASAWGVTAHNPGPGKTVWFRITPTA